MNRISLVALAVGSLALYVVAFSAACDREGESSSESTAEREKSEQSEEEPEPPETVDGPAIPREGGRFAPSLIRSVEEEPDAEVLTEVERCAECHSEIVDQWRDSMHRWASFNNPLYRIAFDDFVEANGHETGKFCAGCHDPVPLFEGKIGAEVSPELESAYAGVTCNTCHGIREATQVGNASLSLTTSEVPVPRDDEPGSLEEHKERLAPDVLDSNAACTSCHRGFLSPATGHEVFILGFDELGPWRRSGWGGSRVTRIDEPVADKDCVDCHMPKSEGSDVRSHRFVGGHTTGGRMFDSDEQVEAIRRLLEDVASIDVAAVGKGKDRFPVDADAFGLEPGGRFWFDVVVRNLGGGHNLPGGQRDLRDTWFEVLVRDNDGELVAEAGRDHGETGEDKSAHRLRKLVLTEEADKQKTHSVAHFRTAAYDRTITPRNAELTRYAWQLPEDFSDRRLPLTVEVRLVHRRLTESFHGESCEAAKTERGEAFLQGAKKHNGVEPDPCVEQPLTVMATDTAELHADRFFPGENKLGWKRWFDRGLALQGHLSERLDEAIDSFDRALEELDDVELDEESRRHRRAMALVGQAQVMARQRRHHDAIETFEKAEKLVSDHPAIFVGRGDAYANVWQFDRAVEEFQKAAEMADDDRVWSKLAIGLGSLDKPKKALVAAQKGLEIEPRDPDLLRSQLLALRKLDVPEGWVERAEQAYETFKRDEEAHLLRAKCSDRSEICELERLPIHTHQLEAP